MGLFVVALGALIAAAGIFNWAWFLDGQRRSHLISFETMFGRTGARVVYTIIGLILIVAGLASL